MFLFNSAILMHEVARIRPVAELSGTSFGYDINGTWQASEDDERASVPA